MGIFYFTYHLSHDVIIVVEVDVSIFMISILLKILCFCPFFGPVFTQLSTGVKMIPDGVFLSAINLYYIYMKLEYLKDIIFYIIEDYVFSTPFWTLFYLCCVLGLGHYLKMIPNWSIFVCY